MTSGDGFHVGIEFESVLKAISKQIYETPLAFIRENVQNGIDAIRLQAARHGTGSDDPSLFVRISVHESHCTIIDNGIGMSLDDLQGLFWTIGASGKRTVEARDAGCVGMFGIGGFANFGVCDELVVVSQTEDSTTGTSTSLSRQAIEAASGGIPVVSVSASDEAAPRGTIVRGRLESPPDAAELREYLTEFVRYASEHVFFGDDLVSGQRLGRPTSNRVLERLTPSAESWSNGNVTVLGRLYEDATRTLEVRLEGLQANGDDVRLSGWIRFDSGVVDVLKRGFKLCSTGIPTQIGVSGAIDCDLLSPTAGRDSLDAESSSLVGSIVGALEKAAVLAVLESTERISQHTRIFKYVRQQGLVDRLGRVGIELADGTELVLDDVRRLAAGGSQVYFATSQNRNLTQVLSARGHTVVQLPADRHKQAAIQQFLVNYCEAQALEGRVELVEVYQALTRFERAFLAELEDTILSTYELETVELVPGKLTEDIPVYAAAENGSEFTVTVDVRHAEITKLESLGINSLFASMVAAFCREYLGSILRTRSPKFFGTGALNLEWLAKKRSELWVLLSNDIETVSRGTERQVVSSADIRVVQIGGGRQANVDPGDGPRHPKLVRIEGSDEFAGLDGHYLRVPSSASAVYGDIIQQCEARGVVWGGNRIQFLASDEISTAFEFEVRLDHLISMTDGSGAAGGAAQVLQPLQALFDGLYFAIPGVLEPALVPAAGQEIRIEVRCEWIDYTTARAWEPVAVGDTDSPPDV